MFKPNDIVRIEKLDLKDTFPLYGQSFKLEEGDICKILVIDFSDKRYTYFLRLGKHEFWLSSDSALEVINEKENKNLRQEIENVISQLNKLLDSLDNE